MNRLSAKEGSLPNTSFDGHKLRYGPRRSLELCVGVPRFEEKDNIYWLGHRLLTPSRLSKMKECPACFGTRVKEEETEQQQQGTRLHRYLATNPWQMDGALLEEEEMVMAARYYEIAHLRKRRYPDLSVECEQNRIGYLIPGTDLDFLKCVKGFSIKGLIELPLMARTDQVWRSKAERLTRICDLKLSGGRKNSNILQPMSGALMNLQKDEGFPVLSIYNLKNGVEEVYRSRNGEEAMIWFLQILTWGNLLAIGGWKWLNPEHTHARTVEEKLKTPSGRRSLESVEPLKMIINGKKYALKEVWDKYLRAWDNLGSHFETETINWPELLSKRKVSEVN